MNPIRSFWHRRLGSGQLTSGPFYALFPTTKNTRTGIYSHGNGNGRNFSVLATLNTEGVKRAPEVWELGCYGRRRNNRAGSVLGMHPSLLA